MMPREVEKWVYYDIKKFKYILKKDAPDKIKKEFETWLEETNDFILDNSTLFDEEKNTQKK